MCWSQELHYVKPHRESITDRLQFIFKSKWSAIVAGLAKCVFLIDLKYSVLWTFMSTISFCIFGDVNIPFFSNYLYSWYHVCKLRSIQITINPTCSQTMFFSTKKDFLRSWPSSSDVLLMKNQETFGGSNLGLTVWLVSQFARPSTLKYSLVSHVFDSAYVGTVHNLQVFINENRFASHQPFFVTHGTHFIWGFVEVLNLQLWRIVELNVTRFIFMATFD